MISIWNNAVCKIEMVWEMFINQKIIFAFVL
jgi:hypothetical protein